MDPQGRSEQVSPQVGALAETVMIQVPADPDYLPVIRSASAHLATRLGCTLPEVADVRLAVDEAGGLLLRHTVRELRTADGAAAADGATDAAATDAPDGDLECRFVLDGSALQVVLSRQARDVVAPRKDDFGWTILSALVDDIVWRVEGTAVRVEILKRRAGGG
ncbi:putative anti-sigma regulatory factor, serine/threonine protein kinase [Catenulispora acidiphila DSM 44928]|uniref:Putative anti-sigma regulatory factor, serine/threonine protein kinase n=1 Tax=Catenulispora acidiphila (strain DSM 44928 / JCM 14897 / NBRC 102108 / NRRL B-24433 / ID139908) TaxID=479433 RepID=C7Q1H8_CATAD|nr:ATP-binding protein [Catenulispora acidiphila]ACU73707.1 putative anti-sigma regulatory factor, serine/threonine protein kinase [Catenulispora acidiphila DSM 44928]